MKHEKTEPRQIPGVGPSIEQDLIGLGFTIPDSLKGQDPEALFFRDNLQKGVQQDRCLLYVYRLAVCYAEGGREPGKLNWWNWKDDRKEDHP